jgi:mono/diheme cytochrome c family protein
MKTNPLVSLLLTTGLFLAGCKPSAPVSPPAQNAAPHGLDAALIARGSELYLRHCASCHGHLAQGAPHWQKPGPDGKYPPPPLDGSAHAWHHPYAALQQTIRDGTARLGGGMPPWRDKLPEADIEAVIAYFQSLWPEEIYRAWQDIDRQARMGAAKQR